MWAPQLTARPDPCAQALAQTVRLELQSFEPLHPAEQILLNATLQGHIAKIGPHRPRTATPDVVVRAEFLSFLAQGGAPSAAQPERRIQMVGAWVVGSLNWTSRSVPVSLWCFRCVFDSPLLLNASRIEGSLSFVDSALPSLRAEGAVIMGEMALSAGSTVQGEVRLSRASVWGNLNCNRAQLGNGPGQRAAGLSALVAEGTHIGGHVFLEDGFRSVGELRFQGAQIEGNFSAAQARLSAHVDALGARGNALSLDHARVAGNVLLHAGFVASGRVRLQQTRIEGHLDCTGAAFDAAGDLRWDNTPALLLERLRLGGTLRLSHLHTPLRGASLADARVGGLADDASTWGEHLVLNGFHYPRFAPGAPTDATFRLQWLALQAHGPLYSLQPWRQLIQVLRRNGHAHEASHVFIQREKHLRQTGQIGLGFSPVWRWLPRLGHRLYGLVSGYGERPLRPVAAMVGVWLLCGAAYWQGNLALTQYPPAQAPSAWWAWGYSLDTLLPLVDLGAHRPGTVLPTAWQALTWLEALFGWAAIALWMVALSGWVNRDRTH
jgi:hypothetical protein